MKKQEQPAPASQDAITTENAPKLCTCGSWQFHDNNCPKHGWPPYNSKKAGEGEGAQ